MAAHQHAVALAERAGERRAERPVAHQEIVVLAHLADVPHRRTRPEERAHVINRPQLGARDTEGNHRRRMAVHHHHHLGPGAIDLAVDVALDEALAFISNRLTVRPELHHVRRDHQRRRARARHQEVFRPLVAARADVAIGVEHAVAGEDAASRNQVVDELLARGGLLHFCRISLMCGAVT